MCVDVSPGRWRLDKAKPTLHPAHLSSEVLPDSGRCRPQVCGVSEPGRRWQRPNVSLGRGGGRLLTSTEQSAGKHCLWDKVFRAAGLPLVRIQARHAYSVQEISVALQSALSSCARDAHLTAPTFTSAEQAQHTAAPLCPKCGVPMVIRKSRTATSRFYGCPNFPRCREIAPLGQQS